MGLRYICIFMEAWDFLQIILLPTCLTLTIPRRSSRKDLRFVTFNEISQILLRITYVTCCFIKLLLNINISMLFIKFMTHTKNARKDSERNIDIIN
jgi:hypothetical protein